MGKPYALDLRERICAYVPRGIRLVILARIGGHP
jgi:hypothetical protein